MAVSKKPTKGTSSSGKAGGGTAVTKAAATKTVKTPKKQTAASSKNLKSPAKPSKSGAKKPAPSKKTAPTPPSAGVLEKLKGQDEGFALAQQNAVQFLNSRKQGIYNIARRYHLDPDELLQEGYEVLLTCLRDFNPIHEKKDGQTVEVQFTTFFGNRMDIQALTMRNNDPEYKARQAYLDDLNDDERDRFRANPPLLVQHIDQESTLQDQLDMEISEMKGSDGAAMALRIERDSFFEEKLSELIANEKDDRKKTALLQVKVGGVYNFQEMAYHFGVTDSRASQVLNDLVDAFYTQRLIDKDIKSVAYDFQKLKFNEKRILRLVVDAWLHAANARQAELEEIFTPLYPAFKAELTEAKKRRAEPVAVPSAAAEPAAVEAEGEPAFHMPTAPAYETLLTDKENKDFPLMGVEVWPVEKLSVFEELTFRPPTGEAYDVTYINTFQPDVDAHPLLITPLGQVVDGALRLQAAKAHGMQTLTCVVRKPATDQAAKILRISLNLRLRKPNKTEIYFAVAALADLGLSQSKISDHVGISRTNVLVYAKVREKAAPKLRALFEDGLIQITNAATCVDLPEQTQAELVDFIRRFGPTWSKGTQFNDLYTAAMKGKITQLAAEQRESAAAPIVGAAPQKTTSTATTVADSVVTGALNKRIEAYEQALTDAETWAAQREQVIHNQTDLLDEAHNEISLLKKEIDALELSKYAGSNLMEDHLRALRIFYEVTERLSGATHALKRSSTGIKALNLKRKQVLEVEQLIDGLDQELNSLRITLLGKKPL